MDIVHWVWLMNSSTLESKPFLSRDFRLSQAKRTAEAFRIQIVDEISLHDAEWFWRVLLHRLLIPVKRTIAIFLQYHAILKPNMQSSLSIRFVIDSSKSDSWQIVHHMSGSLPFFLLVKGAYIRYLPTEVHEAFFSSATSINFHDGGCQRTASIRFASIVVCPNDYNEFPLEMSKNEFERFSVALCIIHESTFMDSMLIFWVSTPYSQLELELLKSEHRVRSRGAFESHGKDSLWKQREEKKIQILKPFVYWL